MGNECLGPQKYFPDIDMGHQIKAPAWSGSVPTRELAMALPMPIPMEICSTGIHRRLQLVFLPDVGWHCERRATNPFAVWD